MSAHLVSLVLLLVSVCSPVVLALEYGALPLGTTDYAVPTSNVVFVSVSGSDSASGARTAPVRTLKRAVALAQSGYTIVMRAGHYHESLTISKNVTIQAYPGEVVWFDGSSAVTAWVKKGSVWVNTNASMPKYYRNSGVGWSLSAGEAGMKNAVLSGDPYGDLSDQVFFDDQPLQQIADGATPSVGQFSVNYTANTITIGSDPTGHQVYASDLKLFLDAAAQVNLKGIGVRRYSPDFNSSYTMMNFGGLSKNSVIENCWFMYSACFGVIFSATGGEFRYNTISFAALTALGGSRCHGIHVYRNYIPTWNTGQFTAAPQAAAIKLLRFDGSRNGTLFPNIEHNLIGGVGGNGYAANGIWCDETCVRTVIANNVVYLTGKAIAHIGIHMEDSDGGNWTDQPGGKQWRSVVAGNIVVGTQFGISLYASGHIDIANNLVYNQTTQYLNVNQDSRTFVAFMPFSVDPWQIRSVYLFNNIVGASGYAAPLVPVRYYDKVSNSSPITADEWDGRLYNNFFRDPATTATLIQWGNGKNTYTTYKDPNALGQHPHNVFGNVQASTMAASQAARIPENVAFALGVASGTQLLGPLISLPTSYPPSTPEHPPGSTTASPSPPPTTTTPPPPPPTTTAPPPPTTTAPPPPSTTTAPPPPPPTTTTHPPTTTPSSGVFQHPGVVVSLGQLRYVKLKIAQGAQPWTQAYTIARSGKYGNTSYDPHPRAVVECGSYNKPDNGCSTELADSSTAYSLALLWFYSGDNKYLNASIRILDAWSSTLRAHNNSNAPIQAAWASEFFTKAAEIVRHTSTAWPAASVTRFSNMLRTAFLPLVINGDGWSNGYWELSMADAVISIGVFLDDQVTFNKGVSLWRNRVPAYIYKSPPDGALPVPPPGGHYTTQSQLWSFWNNADGTTPFFTGRAQETCHDFNHVSLGFQPMGLAAETALIQGVDLFSEQKDRLSAALEFHSDWQNNPNRTMPQTLCDGALSLFLTSVTQFEIVYNALANRLNISMPATRQFILKYRPVKNAHQSTLFEALTHAETGWNGINRPGTTVPPSTTTSAPLTTTPAPTTTKPATTTPLPTTTKPATTSPVTTPPPSRAHFSSSDYNGDGVSDYAVWRGATVNSTWFVNGIRATRFGKKGDIPIPADFDGDHKTDLALFRNGTWLILTSASPAKNLTYSYGIAGDIPIPSDFDGDGKADLAVFRPSTGTWYVKTSSSGYATALASVRFGQSGDYPLPADYNGDGKTDIAFWSPTNHTFNLRGIGTFKLGAYATDYPLVMDIDGDRKADLVIFRGTNGTWTYKLSSENYATTHAIVKFGLSTDFPVSNFDADGDGRADFTIYRDGRWASLLSSNSFSSNASKSFGVSTDWPLPGHPIPRVAYDSNGNILSRAIDSSSADSQQSTSSTSHFHKWIVAAVVVAALAVAFVLVAIVVVFRLRQKRGDPERTVPLLEQ